MRNEIKCWQIYWKRKSSIHKMASNPLATSCGTLLLNGRRLPELRVRAQHPNDKMRNSFIHIVLPLSFAIALAQSILSVTFDFNSEIYLFIWLTEFAHSHSDTRTHAQCLRPFHLIYSDIHSRNQLNVWANRECHSIRSSGNLVLFLGDDDDATAAAAGVFVVAAAVISRNVVCLFLFICSMATFTFRWFEKFIPMSYGRLRVCARLC